MKLRECFYSVSTGRGHFSSIVRGKQVKGAVFSAHAAGGEQACAPKALACDEALHNGQSSRLCILGSEVWPTNPDFPITRSDDAPGALFSRERPITLHYVGSRELARSEKDHRLPLLHDLRLT